ncbi:hypothetical protein Ddc_22007 [Ditylenchus destructor]|nr:hypothetical protein Ddc_22007 [Ditylenchus destructor]
MEQDLDSRPLQINRAYRASKSRTGLQTSSRQSCYASSRHELIFASNPPEDKAEAYLECGIEDDAHRPEHQARKGWNEADVKKRAADIEQFVRSEWTE